MSNANSKPEKNDVPPRTKDEPTAHHEKDPRSELGLKSPVKEAEDDNDGTQAEEQKPSQQDPEQGNEIDPSRKEPYGAGGYRSGVDDPEHPTKRNPGHANPSHNTPGHTRQDQPGQQHQGHPGQGQTQSYPGIMGSKARALKEDEPISKDDVKIEPKTE